mgnify:FL=1
MKGKIDSPTSNRIAPLSTIGMRLFCFPGLMVDLPARTSLAMADGVKRLSQMRESGIFVLGNWGVSSHQRSFDLPI